MIPTSLPANRSENSDSINENKHMQYKTIHLKIEQEITISTLNTQNEL